MDGVEIVRRPNGNVLIRKKEKVEENWPRTSGVDLAAAIHAQADENYRTHAYITAERVMHEVTADIEHQFNKWGAQYVNGLGWIAIITEEFGETVQAYLKKNYSEAIKEGKQTIACILRMIVEIEREQGGLREAQADRYVDPQ